MKSSLNRNSWFKLRIFCAGFIENDPYGELDNQNCWTSILPIYRLGPTLIWFVPLLSSLESIFYVERKIFYWVRQLDFFEVSATVFSKYGEVSKYVFLEFSKKYFLHFFNQKYDKLASGSLILGPRGYFEQIFESNFFFDRDLNMCMHYL